MDCKGYLPPFHTVTIYFLKDLIVGKRKFVRMERVNHIYVPAYVTLKLEEIFSFFMQHEAVIAYMSDDKELRRMPKQWVCNVGATIIGQPFIDWCAERVLTRNREMARDRNLLIKMDPKLARAFQRSSAISVSNGSAAHMLKVEVST